MSSTVTAPNRKFGWTGVGVPVIGQGTTTIEIGKIMEGPYNVMVDGSSIDEYEIVTTQNAEYSSIRIHHDNTGSHDVTITGTQVVPEFPLPALLGVMAAIGAVVLAGRTRLIK